MSHSSITVATSRTRLRPQNASSGPLPTEVLESEELLRFRDTLRIEGSVTGTRGVRPRAMVIRRAHAPKVVVALAEGRRYTFGRGDAVEIQLNDERVSRYHAILKLVDGRWRIQDLGSTNGTFIASTPDLVESERTGSPIEGIRLRDGEWSIVESGESIIFGAHAARLDLLELIPRGALHDRVVDDTHVSQAGREIGEWIEVAARSQQPVFLLGASGTGKTFVADRIHKRSGLRGNLEVINCARLPRDATALHSELLGHVRGAFTGAQDQRLGVFQNADGGTLFLDEVESLPELAQGFLLDVLEKQLPVRPLGASSSMQQRPPNFRLISASKRPMSTSGLRRDLAERLAEGHMWTLPLLEERREDIPGLVTLFLTELRDQSQVDVRFTDDAKSQLQRMAWPGNVRQLRSAVRTLVFTAKAHAERLGTSGRVVVSNEDVSSYSRSRERAFGTDDTRSTIVAAVPPRNPRGQPPTAPAQNPVRARALEHRHIVEALEATSGNKTRAAEYLGVARNTLLKKMRQFGIPC